MTGVSGKVPGLSWVQCNSGLLKIGDPSLCGGHSLADRPFPRGVGNRSTFEVQPAANFVGSDLGVLDHIVDHLLRYQGLREPAARPGSTALLGRL